MDTSAVSRYLRELNKLQAFDYVPPFRGRAVHMLERKKPFEKLGIDFDEQQRRKSAEYAKLDRMVGYAATRGCRQIEILDYFGDPNRQKCGTCDNCNVNGLRAGVKARFENSGEQNGKKSTRAGVSRPTELQPQIVEAVLMVLSGAARMKGRFGKQMLARMLIGSKAKNLIKFKLDQLSTFGLLKRISEPQALALIDALLEQRLLIQVEETPHRPLVQLTPQGEEVMKGQAALNGTLNIGDELYARLLAAPVLRPASAAKGG
jgi:ATP-dependent DNA helicase RecQ